MRVQRTPKLARHRGKETHIMAYLIAQLWPFMLLALMVGIAVGWYSVEN
jgi:hypothetical protein